VEVVVLAVADSFSTGALSFSELLKPGFSVSVLGWSESGISVMISSCSSVLIADGLTHVLNR